MLTSHYVHTSEDEAMTLKHVVQGNYTVLGTIYDEVFTISVYSYSNSISFDGF